MGCVLSHNVCPLRARRSSKSIDGKPCNVLLFRPRRACSREPPAVGITRVLFAQPMPITSFGTGTWQPSEASTIFTRWKSLVSFASSVLNLPPVVCERTQYIETDKCPQYALVMLR